MITTYKEFDEITFLKKFNYSINIDKFEEKYLYKENIDDMKNLLSKYNKLIPFTLQEEREYSLYNHIDTISFWIDKEKDIYVYIDYENNPNSWEIRFVSLKSYLFSEFSINKNFNNFLEAWIFLRKFLKLLRIK